MIVATGNNLIDKRNTFAHEFGHLMGALHLATTEKEGLMRDGNQVTSRGRYLAAKDFGMLLGVAARNNIAGSGGPFPSTGSSNSVFARGVYPATTSQVVRARTFNSVKIGN